VCKLSYIKAVSCGHPHVPYFSVLNEHQSWLNKFLCCAMQFEGRHLIVLTINGCMTHVGNERACHSFANQTDANV